MKALSKLTAGAVLVSFLLLFLNLSVYPQEEAPKAELPVLVTSCGQSGGAATFTLTMKIKLKYELGKDYVKEQFATAETLKELQKAGKPVKSVVILTGTSLKGMGAAGVSIDDEVARIKALMKEAKKQGITIIGSHIGGMERRVDKTDALSIDTVCPESDILIIHKDGNPDGRFSKISRESRIPLIEMKGNTELTEVLKNLFKKLDSE